MKLETKYYKIMLANSKRMVIWKLVIKLDEQLLDLKIRIFLQLILIPSIKVMIQKMLFSMVIFIN